jgi:hypothetical protein
MTKRRRPIKGKKVKPGAPSLLEQQQDRQYSEAAEGIRLLAQTFVAAGGDVLQQDHGFTPEQTAAWAIKTLINTRNILGLDRGMIEA